KLEKKPKQLDILLHYMSLITSVDDKEKSYFINKKKLLCQGGSSASLQKLIKQSIFIEKEAVVPRIEQIKPVDICQITLNQEQNKALENIKSQFKNIDTVLLHGVTGSGKTEIYIELIQE